MNTEARSALKLPTQIVTAESAAHIHHVSELFKEYAASLDFELDFQDFQTEMAHLPGDYTPPQGCLLLALVDKEPAGCIALRKWSRDICEMKRLYVRRKFRGHGLGRLLAQALIDKARQLGYRRMRLDTVPVMRGARGLYRSLGFHNIAPYRYNPVEGAEYMELLLEKL